ncbi:hypothetical protein MB02_15120 [Croceicoccus estronivorus]|uniref:class I adenylate-forming enzyme family protein n=1 Tax=Croceicoccus estronivorus TaxID=1172626 RepID=UPI000830765A|nr:fatty acid--CoA ligase family protein [Croceicoccus estronivorus]OCC22743.1 hypothetical protein MB02_15120 [Croceicoccus estronivorus]
MADILAEFVANLRSGLLDGDDSAIILHTPGETYTRAEFRELVASLVVGLQDAGVGPASRLVYHFPEARALGAALPIAAYFLGFSYMQAKPAFDYEDLVATHFIKDPVSPQLSLHGAQAMATLEFGVTRRVSNAADVITRCPGPSSGEDVGPIIPSSGTTGIPKAVPVGFRALAIYCTKAPAAHPEIVRSASLFPTASLGGLIRLMVGIAGGGSYFDAFGADAERILHYRPETLAGSPAQIASFIRQCRPLMSEPLPRATCGGGFLSAPLALAMSKHFREVYVGYGASEVGAICEMLVEQGYQPGVVGTPWSGCEVQVVDGNDDPRPVTDVGAVRLRSGTMCHGYLGKSDVHDAESFRDGWFYPGDHGRLLPDGRLQIVGREADHLNIGGVKVNALIIDEIMVSAEGVKDAACFILPGEMGIGRLSAMIVREDGFDIEVIKQNIVAAFHGDPRTRPTMVPRHIFSASALPRNENGKIMRHVATKLAGQLA